MQACSVNSMDMIHELLQLRADINARTNDGKTPLDIATSREAKTALLMQAAQPPLYSRCIILRDCMHRLL